MFKKLEGVGAKIISSFWGWSNCFIWDEKLPPMVSSLMQPMAHELLATTRMVRGITGYESTQRPFYFIQIQFNFVH
jgi:hypothetical protein